MVPIAMILALISPGLAGEKIRKSKASRFREVAKVGMKFAFCKTSLRVVRLQLSISFTSSFILISSSKR